MEKKKSGIIIALLMVVIIGLVAYIFIDKSKREDETTKAMNNIGKAANDYIEGIKNAKSHLNEFSYNNTTGEVDYKPTITLEMYNRIKEGMNKNDIISILGKEDNIIKNDEADTYIVEYGESYLTKGYWIQIILNKSDDKVVKKYQTGLK